MERMRKTTHGMAMAITEDDLVVLTVALVQKYGENDTLQLEDKWIGEASTRIEDHGGKISLIFTADPQGKLVNITCIFPEEQRKEWARMGITRGDQ